MDGFRLHLFAVFPMQVTSFLLLLSFSFALRSKLTVLQRLERGQFFAFLVSIRPSCFRLLLSFSFWSPPRSISLWIFWSLSNLRQSKVPFNVDASIVSLFLSLIPSRLIYYSAISGMSGNRCHLEGRKVNRPTRPSSKPRISPVYAKKSSS
jgi:hypothetical protein